MTLFCYDDADAADGDDDGAAVVVSGPKIRAKFHKSQTDANLYTFMLV